MEMEIQSSITAEQRQWIMQQPLYAIRMEKAVSGIRVPFENSGFIRNLVAKIREKIPFANTGLDLESYESFCCHLLSDMEVGIATFTINTLLGSTPEVLFPEYEDKASRYLLMVKDLYAHQQKINEITIPIREKTIKDLYFKFKTEKMFK